MERAIDGIDYNARMAALADKIAGYIAEAENESQQYRKNATDRAYYRGLINGYNRALNTIRNQER